MSSSHELAAESPLATPEELIDEARNGRMFILVDDEDRENEGDFVIPAQMATPDAINFMAVHGRGLICLALTADRADALGLQPMAARNRSRHETAFTVSIEAKDGVSTGISAADRARTIAVAINTTADAGALVTPGHVFPLVARKGGVLVRAGHTEAAVDIARLAGLNPSGVICEVMKDDGTMARLADLIPFAQRHGLKIGTIRDLIAYRRKHDHLVERRGEASVESRWGGRWRTLSFFNRATQTEQLVLVKGQIDASAPTLVRMHTFSYADDLLGEVGPRAGLLRRAMVVIAREGSGVIVILGRPMPDSLSRAMAIRHQRPSPDPDYVAELRDYGVGAQVLAELGVHEMILLTNSHQTPVALKGYGLQIVGEQPLPPDEPSD